LNVKLGKICHAFSETQSSETEKGLVYCSFLCNITFKLFFFRNWI